MTGWGQNGPLAPRAGHDINYIALDRRAACHRPRRAGAGAAAQPGRRLRRRRDAAGLRRRWRRCIEARQSGRGQVVDAAMVDGAASLMATMFARLAGAGPVARRARREPARRRRTLVRQLRDRDGSYVAIGALEPQFYARAARAPRARRRPRLPPARPPPLARDARSASPPHCAGQDPRRVVRDLRRHATPASRRCSTSPRRRAHPHNLARGAHVRVDGIEQPAPAPRFVARRARCAAARPSAARCGRAALVDWGFAADEIERLTALGLSCAD